MTLRLEWSRTWPDKPEDFSCHVDGQPIGRIHSGPAPRDGVKQWHWSAYGEVGNVQLTDRGIVASKQEAAEAVEAAYFRVKGSS